MQRKVTFTSGKENIYIDGVTGYMMRQGNAFEISLSQKEYENLVNLDPFDRLEIILNIIDLNHSNLDLIVENDTLKWNE